MSASQECPSLNTDSGASVKHQAYTGSWTHSRDQISKLSSLQGAGVRTRETADRSTHMTILVVKEAHSGVSESGQAQGAQGGPLGR